MQNNFLRDINKKDIGEQSRERKQRGKWKKEYATRNLFF